MTGKRGAGFSLLEVLLALSILLASLIVLGQMAVVGRKHAEDAEQLTAAQLACRSQLSEILAGAAALESRAPAPLDGLPGWSCRIDVDTVGEFGLVAVRVTAAKGSVESAEADTGRTVKRFSLIRWMSPPAEIPDRTLP
jgi:Tfp pilus assembly protein PilV